MQATDRIDLCPIVSAVHLIASLQHDDMSYFVSVTDTSAYSQNTIPYTDDRK